VYSQPQKAVKRCNCVLTFPALLRLKSSQPAPLTLFVLFFGNKMQAVTVP